MPILFFTEPLLAAITLLRYILQTNSMISLWSYVIFCRISCSEVDRHAIAVVSVWHVGCDHPVGIDGSGNTLGIEPNGADSCVG